MRLHIVTLFLLLIPVGSSAQSKPIELFDGKDDTPGKITISSSDSDDASDPYEFSDNDGNAFGGSFRLKYERAVSGILVSAKVNGKKVYFLFDTGASYTTLSTAFAKSVGAKPPKDAPTSTMNTANGPRTTQFGVIGNLELGGRKHSGVTFAICDACPSGTYQGKPVVGLLGMNVLGRYRTSFDDGKGEIEMSPTNGFSNRRRDVMPFVQLGEWNLFAGKRGLQGSVVVRNRGWRRLRDLVIRFDCPAGKTYRSPKATVSSRNKKKVKLDFGTYKCERPNIDLESVSW